MPFAPLNQLTFQNIVRKLEPKKKISRDLKTRVHEAAQDISSGGPTVTEMNDLADLLSTCLNLNVEKRMSPKDATNHKFFGSKSVVPKSAVVKPPMMKRGAPGVRR
jgi:serine/threonine-protein kinase PRP4